MELKDYLSEVRTFLQSNADPKIVEKYSRYFKEGYDAYGVSKEKWDKQKNEWIKEWQEVLGFDGFLRLGDNLIENGKYEECSCAIAFMKPFSELFTEDTYNHFGSWLEKGIQNWAHTDMLCGEILSPMLKNKKVKLTGMISWRESTSKWKRRAVPVSMLGLLKETEDYSQLLEFISPMMMDNERVVHQGLGWFLREAWKIKPEWVETYLMEWKDTAPRLISQYATEKMTAEKKLHFRRKKK